MGGNVHADFQLGRDNCRLWCWFGGLFFFPFALSLAGAFALRFQCARLLVLLCVPFSSVFCSTFSPFGGERKCGSLRMIANSVELYVWKEWMRESFRLVWAQKLRNAKTKGWDGQKRFHEQNDSVYFAFGFDTGWEIYGRMRQYNNVAWPSVTLIGNWCIFSRT